MLRSKALKASASGTTSSKRKRGLSDVSSARKVTARSVLSSAFRLSASIDGDNEPTNALSSAFHIQIPDPGSDSEDLPEGGLLFFLAVTP